MAKKHSDVLVSKNPGRTTWMVTQHGETLSNHRTQANAVDAGRREAKGDGVDLTTHGRDLGQANSPSPEPNVRQLEPDGGLAGADRGVPARGVNARDGRRDFP